MTRNHSDVVLKACDTQTSFPRSPGNEVGDTNVFACADRNKFDRLTAKFASRTRFFGASISVFHTQEICGRKSADQNKMALIKRIRLLAASFPGRCEALGTRLGCWWVAPLILKSHAKKSPKCYCHTKGNTRLCEV